MVNLSPVLGPVIPPAPSSVVRELPAEIPWQAWAVLRQIRMWQHDDTVPFEFRITEAARVMQSSKGNVIKGIDWLIEYGVVSEHQRTAFGARIITVRPGACLCGGEG